jgi:hypothetical protein
VNTREGEECAKDIDVSEGGFGGYLWSNSAPFTAPHKIKTPDSFKYQGLIGDIYTLSRGTPLMMNRPSISVVVPIKGSEPSTITVAPGNDTIDSLSVTTPLTL